MAKIQLNDIKIEPAFKWFLGGALITIVVLNPSIIPGALALAGKATVSAITS